MKEINPKDTTRSYAFDMWMQAPMPMVTFFKTLDVSHLLKISRRRGLKFNMLMCYCIGRAAVQIKEFLPRRTLHNHITAIKEMFVIEIECRKQLDIHSFSIALLAYNPYFAYL